MVAFNKFEVSVGNMWTGVHDFTSGGNQIEVYLSNATPSASADSIKTDLAEIATGNGYTGPQDTANNMTETTGTATITGTDVTITASGGSVGPFQYVVYFDTTPTSPLDPLIGWWDNGSAVTLNDGESFTVDFGASVHTLV
jgi:hypothetical protein